MTKKEFKAPTLRTIDVQASSLLAASGQAITGTGTASFGQASGGSTGEYADSKSFMVNMNWE